MAKQLMQARHELEASKRVSSEYAERTHAAEKAAAKYREKMQEAKGDYAQLTLRHEELEKEVQVQRNRVANLRLKLTRLESDDKAVVETVNAAASSPLGESAARALP